MDYSVLEKSPLFRGLSAEELRQVLQEAPHHIQCYEKGEIVFRQMDEARRIGLMLEGQVEAEKTFPNGSMVNVSIRRPGDLIGPAAAFSKDGRYPCDVAALCPVTIMMINKEDALALMQKDKRILNNFITQISTAAYLLQQRIELFSYSGISRRAAFWLLMKKRESERDQIPVPGSMTKWATLMNVSRPSLHRELKKMESQGLILYSPKSIKILDAAGLEELLSD